MNWLFVNYKYQKKRERERERERERDGLVITAEFCGIERTQQRK